MSTRRSFLVLTSGAALASAMPKSLFAQSGEPDLFSNRNLGAYTQGLLSKSNFEAAVGSVFTLFFEGANTASLTLLAVTTPRVRTTAISQAAASLAARQLASLPGAAVSTPASSCFFAKFSTGLTFVPQGTYRLDHGRLGSFAVLLVPGDPRQPGICTACFNYL